ncbi:MAG: hypothetical protein DCC75_02730 [Proteobacteria bacterium]|nr:MAG: hypothetical protein DCC75_02730 [Pseudomonadota bacterium]
MDLGTPLLNLAWGKLVFPCYSFEEITVALGGSGEGTRSPKDSSLRAFLTLPSRVSAADDQILVAAIDKVDDGHFLSRHVNNIGLVQLRNLVYLESALGELRAAGVPFEATISSSKPFYRIKFNGQEQDQAAGQRALVSAYRYILSRTAAPNEDQVAPAVLNAKPVTVKVEGAICPDANTARKLVTMLYRGDVPEPSYSEPAVWRTGNEWDQIYGGDQGTAAELHESLRQEWFERLFAAIDKGEELLARKNRGERVDLERALHSGNFYAKDVTVALIPDGGFLIGMLERRNDRSYDLTERIVEREGISVAWRKIEQRFTIRPDESGFGCIDLCNLASLMPTLENTRNDLSRLGSWSSADFGCGLQVTLSLDGAFEIPPFKIQADTKILFRVRQDHKQHPEACLNVRVEISRLRRNELGYCYPQPIYPREQAAAIDLLRKFEQALLDE